VNFLLIFILALPGLPASVAKVSCVAANYQEVLVHVNADKSATELEIDDWRVSCKITVGEEVIFNEALTTVHPESFEDAMVAINEFRKVRSVKILANYKKR
jgi:hypothetical protein